MRILERIKSWFPPGPPQLWTPSWTAAAGYTPHRDTPNVMPTPAQSLGLSPVLRCITAICDPVTAAALEVVRDIPSGGRERVHGTDAGIALREWSYSDKEQFVFEGLWSGNAYAEIMRSGRGSPIAISTIPFWRVALEVDHDTGAYRYRLAEDPTVGEPERIIEPRNMIHLKYRQHGRHKLLGVSVLATAAPSMGVVWVRYESERDVFQNWARPSGFLAHPKRVSEATRKRLSQAWTDNYGRGAKRGGTAVLEEGLSYNNLDPIDAQRMQVSELAAVDVRTVCRLFGIPPHICAEDSTTNYSTAAEAQRGYGMLTLLPWAERFSNVLTNALLTRDQRSGGMRVHADLSPLLRGSGDELAQYLSRLLNAGLITPNEGRAQINLPNIEGADELRSPVNTLPYDVWQNYDPSAGTPAATSTGAEQNQNNMLPIEVQRALSYDDRVASLDGAHSAGSISDEILSLVDPGRIQIEGEFEELFQ